jgi:hypothetical protein
MIAVNAETVAKCIRAVSRKNKHTENKSKTGRRKSW